MADTLESLEIEVKHSASGADAELAKVTDAIRSMSRALGSAVPQLREYADLLGKIGKNVKGRAPKIGKINAPYLTGDWKDKMLSAGKRDLELFEARIAEGKMMAALDNNDDSGAVRARKAYLRAIQNVGGDTKDVALSETAQKAIEESSAIDVLTKKLERLKIAQQEAFAKGDSFKGNDIQGQILKTQEAIDKATKKATPPTPVDPQFQEAIKSISSDVDYLKLKLEALRDAQDAAFKGGDLMKGFSIQSQIMSTEKALAKANQAAAKTQNAMQSASKGMKELAKSTDKTKGPLDRLIASFKRVMLYRALRRIIQAIGQAMQEGLQNAYAFSAGITSEGHRFAAALDSMKTAGTTMKNQLGSAFIGLLAAIAPIVNAIIGVITKLANALSQLFAIFTGGTYLKAADVPQKWADAAGGAANAAKEWRNQLLGFDEINRLEKPDDGSGGGGGGTNPLAGYEMVDTPINEKLLKLVDNIKQKLQPALDGLKDALGRLKEAWDRFKESLSQDGALSRFIEDLIALGGSVVIDGLTVLADLLTLILDILTAFNTGDWSKAWESLKWLLYDIVVLVADLAVGITNLLMDALIGVAEAIDDIAGTHLADYLRADNDEFNRMYNEAKNSENGLFGLKRALGLVEDTAETAATESDDFTESLAAVGSQASKTETRTRGIRAAIEWVVDGFRWFGGEVGLIVSNMIAPIQDFCNWIDSAIQGLGIFHSFARVNAPGYNVYNDASMWTSNFATGGFPDEGQLFVAREAGAEMVGTMGGRTAVANNDQIVEGIRQGVFEAVSAAMGNGNQSVNVKVYLDSREIKAGQQRLNRAWGA